jgi:hypothetical protein
MDIKRQAEVRVFKALRDQLDDRYVVFYSSPWLGTDRYGQEVEGECDFVIAHPNHGFLAIEVKGGGVNFEPRDGVWSTIDRNGFQFRLKQSPASQASRSKHALLAKMRSDPLLKGRWIPSGTGVILPDVRLGPRDLSAEIPRSLICDRDQLDRELAGWTKARFDAIEPAEGTDFGDEGIKALERLIASRIALSFTLRMRINDAEVAFGNLEPYQFQALQFIEAAGSAEVIGGAGSGKTVVALELAIRAARSGKRTLLTCFNRPLAAHLARLTVGTPNLQICSFHALAVSLAVPRDATKVATDDLAAAEAIVDAMEENSSLQYDLIVVDEGQDFRTEWWVALSVALRPDGRTVVFSDANQALYAHRSRPLGLVRNSPLPLSFNLRNPKPVHAEASKLYIGTPSIGLGPEGPPVARHESASLHDATLIVMKQVQRLLTVEQAALGDIAVLLPDAETAALVRSIIGSSGRRTTDSETFLSDAVIVDTTRRFKGLERPIIIAILAEGGHSDREMAYVATTRARYQLIIVEVLKTEIPRSLNAKEQRDTAE